MFFILKLAISHALVLAW